MLIVGRTSCGKTTFIQKLATKDFFGELKKAEQIYSIKLSKIREAQIQSCLKCEVEFHHPRNILELEKVMDEFEVRSKVSETTDDLNKDNNLD